MACLMVSIRSLPVYGKYTSSGWTLGSRVQELTLVQTRYLSMAMFELWPDPLVAKPREAAVRATGEAAPGAITASNSSASSAAQALTKVSLWLRLRPVAITASNSSACNRESYTMSAFESSMTNAFSFSEFRFHRVFLSGPSSGHLPIRKNCKQTGATCKINHRRTFPETLFDPSSASSLQYLMCQESRALRAWLS